MASYIVTQFENHPSINSEYIKFLATNSGNNKVEDLGLEVKALKEDGKVALQIKALKEEVKKEALAKVKAAVTKADVATGKADTLAKRVVALEEANKKK